MKPFLLTLLAISGIAYAGAFFNVWEISLLPEDHVTAKQVGDQLSRSFDFTSDLQEIRAELQTESAAKAKQNRFVSTP